MPIEVIINTYNENGIIVFLSLAVVFGRRASGVFANFFQLSDRNLQNINIHFERTALRERMNILKEILGHFYHEHCRKCLENEHYMYYFKRINRNFKFKLKIRI